MSVRRSHICSYPPSCNLLVSNRMAAPYLHGPHLGKFTMSTCNLKLGLHFCHLTPVAAALMHGLTTDIPVPASPQPHLKTAASLWPQLRTAASCQHCLCTADIRPAPVPYTPSTAEITKPILRLRYPADYYSLHLIYSANF